MQLEFFRFIVSGIIRKVFNRMYTEYLLYIAIEFYRNTRKPLFPIGRYLC
jgi:hypothetical protein